MLADVIRVQLVVGREVGEYPVLVERTAGDGVGAEVPANLTALRMELVLVVQPSTVMSSWSFGFHCSTP